MSPMPICAACDSARKKTEMLLVVVRIAAILVWACAASVAVRSYGLASVQGIAGHLLGLGLLFASEPLTLRLRRQTGHAPGMQSRPG